VYCVTESCAAFVCFALGLVYRIYYCIFATSVFNFRVFSESEMACLVPFCPSITCFMIQKDNIILPLNSGEITSGVEHTTDGVSMGSWSTGPEI
jgi:hypothetical protein